MAEANSASIDRRVLTACTTALVPRRSLKPAGTSVAPSVCVCDAVTVAVHEPERMTVPWASRVPGVTLTGTLTTSGPAAVTGSGPTPSTTHSANTMSPAASSITSCGTSADAGKEDHLLVATMANKKTPHAYEKGKGDGHPRGHERRHGGEAGRVMQQARTSLLSALGTRDCDG